MRLCWGLQCICMVAHAITSSAGHAEDGNEVQKADLGAQAADGAAAPILGTPASAKPGQRCLCLSVYLQVVHWNGSDGGLGICYGLSHCMLTGRSEDSLSAVADRLNEGREAEAPPGGEDEAVDAEADSAAGAILLLVQAMSDGSLPS